MSYEFYKILHLAGLIMLFSGLTSLLTLKITGVAIEGTAKKFAYMTHGIGLFFILLSGFGLLARLNIIGSWPNWVFGKLIIWLYFGVFVILIKKRGQMGWALYAPIIGVFIIAAYLAVLKPF